MTALYWIIDYYESATGNKPVENFINSLEGKAQDKIVRTLELLEEFGIRLGLPHAKKLVGTPLWEKHFLLLHGFIKKTQKTDKKELMIALSRLREYASRNK